MHQRILIAAFILGATLIGIFRTPVNAGPITFNFAATITSVDPDLSSRFSTGQTISGSYTFESTTGDTLGSLNRGFYDGAVTALSFTTSGGYSGVNSAISIDDIIIDDNFVGADRYFIQKSFSGDAVGGFSPSLLSFELIDPSQTAFINDSLPLTAPNLASFGGTKILSLVFSLTGTGNLVFVRGTVTSLTAVPEPTSLSLLGFGVVALFLRRRRQS